jgi:UDPglucose 6-dehydrogenase
MITVIGLGFVGLTTALGFSKKGFNVYGIDVNPEKVGMLRQKKVPFYEPHVAEVLEETLDDSFFLDVPLADAVRDSKAIFICVGTPSQPDGSADLTYLLEAIRAVVAASPAEGFRTLIVKSTVPPSTISRQVQPVVEELAASLGKEIGLASNPEFLREGYAWDDFMNPDRVVIGVEDARSKVLLQTIYEPFKAPIHYVSFNSAEFIKYLSNTLLSTLISYSNEMAMIAEHIGDIDVPSAFRILHQDKRWSGKPASMASYVFPGCGYGGYCLPKDTSALNSIAIENGFTPKILKGNLEINEEIKHFMAQKLMAASSPDECIGILGLSFKSGSDDVRLTPSRDIIEKLLAAGYTNLVAYDPMSNESFQREYQVPINYVDDLESLVEQADKVVILTAWQEFKEKQALIHQRPVFDFRYMYAELNKPAGPAPASLAQATR